MLIRLMALLALMLPAAALAQVAPPRGTSVEILARGEVDVPANSFVVRIDWTSKGEDENAARKAQAEQEDAVRKTLGSLGVADSVIAITQGEITTEVDYSSDDWMTNTVLVEDVVVENSTEDYVLPAPVYRVKDFAIVRLTSLAQVGEVKKAMTPLGAKVASVTPTLDDPDMGRRQAKGRALTAARADAEAYAALLGMRVVRVIRISETGNGLFLPSFQDKMQTMIMAGPRAMANMFPEPKPGFVHLEASIIVEFELAPLK